jgi:penicillin-binding protein 2
MHARHPRTADELASALDRSRRRVLILMALPLLGAAYLVHHLLDLQLARPQAQTALGDRQRKRQIILPPARGLVADRWGSPLAELRPTVDIDLYLVELKSHYITRHRRIPEVTSQIYVRGTWKAQKESDIVTVVDESLAPFKKLLGDKLQYDPEKLKRHHREQPEVPFKVSSDLTYDELARISEQNPNTPGVVLTPRPKRRYSYGATASHIIGYVNEPEPGKFIERDGLKFLPDLVGREGIEASFDAELQGSPGFRELEVNRSGRVTRVLNQRYPTLGNTVHLTIDLRVQQIVEKVMAPVGRGAACVVDCNTGEILALVSVPNFDPNTVLSKDVWAAIQRNETRPLVDRCLAAYSPGSIFKPVVALAALQSGAITPTDTAVCHGGLTVQDRYKKCTAFKYGGHGAMALIQALKKSCNVYFYQYGMKCGPKPLEDLSARLGLGKATGVPLSGEARGIIPGPEWMRRTHPRDRWSAGHMANTAIGQGFVEVTPLQMALVTATIANGGTVYRPRLVSRVVAPNGTLVSDRSRPEILDRIALPPADFEAVRRGMRAVVQDEGGTGRAAAIPGQILAGKTGTAQFRGRIQGRVVSDQRTWFICFGPYDQPRYSVVVLVEGGESGGKTCAPIAGAILKQIFELEQFNKPYPLTYLKPHVGHFDGIRDVDPTTENPQPGDEPGDDE